MLEKVGLLALKMDLASQLILRRLVDPGGVFRSVCVSCGGFSGKNYFVLG